MAFNGDPTKQYVSVPITSATTTTSYPGGISGGCVLGGGGGNGAPGNNGQAGGSGGGGANGIIYISNLYTNLPFEGQEVLFPISLQHHHAR